MNRKRFALVLLFVLGVAGIVICQRCNRMPMPYERDISDQPQYLNGLIVGGDYELSRDVFVCCVEGDASLHPPHSLWCEYGIGEYRDGLVTNQFVKDVLEKGNRLRFRRAVLVDFITHTVIDYYAVLLTGKHRGQEVLINFLTDDPLTWLGEVTPKEKEVHEK